MLLLRCSLMLAAAFLSLFAVVSAQDRDSPAEGRRHRDGDRESRERGDGDRPERDHGPRDGDRPDRGGHSRDGGRPPRHDGESREGDRRSQPMGPILELLDSNHNGVLESEEIDQAIVALRKIDRNGDGRLTGEEFGQRREEERPPTRESDRDRGDRPPEGDREGKGKRPTAEQMRERFLEADENGDKKLSKEEAPERLKGSFDHADADGSGFIEESEMDAVVRRLEQGGRSSRGGQGRGSRGGERGRGDGERGKGRPSAE